MPTWRSVIEDKNYKRLSIFDKYTTKQEFFKNVISNSEKFTGSSKEKKSRLEEDFFIPKTEEGLTFKQLEERKPSISDIAQLSIQEFRRSKFGMIDKPFEQIAGMIEPKTAKKGFVGALKFIPRQMAADVVRAYKPTTVAPFFLGMKAIAPLLKPVGKFIAAKTPKRIKDVLLKEFTIGKGQPKEFRSIKKEAELEKAIGFREAEKVAETLTTKPFVKPSGKIVKKPLSIPEQKYVGRIFRKEIDLGGKVSRITEPIERTRRIAKNVEVEVGFSKKVSLQRKELNAINTILRDKEIFAQSLVGKKFITKTGFVEEVTDISKVGKILKSGKESTKRFDIGVVTEPVAPKPPTVTPIPSELVGGEEIVRGLKQVSKLPAVNKFINLSRKELLKQRRTISKQLQKEIEVIEIGVRSNYHIFNRKFTEQIRNHPKYKELSSIADEGRSVMDKWSKALTESGIPKEQAREVIEKNIGEYMARMYTSKIKPQRTSFNLLKDLRLRLTGLKHRKDLSDEVRMSMGEIKEPALPVAIRVKEISASIANNKIFSKVAKNPEWVADTNVSGSMIKMPDVASVGALRNKWVIPEIAEDINAIVTMNNQTQGFYLRFLSAWKYGKVVLNPAAQTRNFMSNTILLDLSGVSHLKQTTLFPKAFKEYLSKGSIYKQALDDGAIGGEFVGTETMQRLRNVYINSQKGNFQRWVDIASVPLKKPGEMYQGMEQVSKIVKYMDVLNKTGNRKLAAEEAQKWLFNYREVPKFIEATKTSILGAPFITFTYKAIPRIAETLVTRPMTVYKYYALFNAVNESSRKYQGMTPVEFARQERALPPWLLRDIGGIPANLLLPYTDQYGRTQWLNLEYILPIGQAPEIAERGLAGWYSNPVFNLSADLVKNMNFMGKEIIPPEATPKEAAEAMLLHIYRTLAPNLAPGGFSYEKIRAGAAKEPERFAPERTRELVPALLDTLIGIKINPLDVSQSENFKVFSIKKRIGELKKEFYRIDSNPILKQEEKEKRIESLFKKMNKVLEELP